MIKKYKAVFDKHSPYREFWIESCVLKSIHSFLNNPENEGFDGVRFFLGGKKGFPSTKSKCVLSAHCWDR